jgi:hypothetical protein
MYHIPAGAHRARDALDCARLSPRLFVIYQQPDSLGIVTDNAAMRIAAILSVSPQYIQGVPILAMTLDQWRHVATTYRLSFIYAPQGQQGNELL